MTDPKQCIPIDIHGLSPKIWSGVTFLFFAATLLNVFMIIGFNRRATIEVMDNQRAVLASLVDLNAGISAWVKVDAELQAAVRATQDKAAALDAMQKKQQAELDEIGKVMRRLRAGYLGKKS